MNFSKINSPKKLKQLEENELDDFSKHLRDEMIETVAKVGGHLGSSLGVVELTIALHYLFDSPTDKIIFDVGHQAYPHKMLTKRRDKMLTIRQAMGISGFTNIFESEHDAFGAGHSSTAISAGLGILTALKKKKSEAKVIAIVGDGALSAGLAFEGLNNTSHNANSNFIVILNDNGMSIDPPSGSLSGYLSNLIAKSPLEDLRKLSYQLKDHLPKNILESFKLPLRVVDEIQSDVRRGLKSQLSKVQNLDQNLFENLGFKYYGIYDGHDIYKLLEILRIIKNSQSTRPSFLHIQTAKGKGYSPAEESYDKYHGVSSFSVSKGITKSKASESYSSVFGKALVLEAEADENIYAITAAMPSGTGLTEFSKKFKDRFFDVGIAEQHAVTFAGGLAKEGLKPVVAIYSTFLQRAYDQIVHDIAIQKLAVSFAIDRAGYVGQDGATHAGSFDITFLSCLPNMIVMAPSDRHELITMLKTSLAIKDQPSAFRYPRGNAIELFQDQIPKILEIGKGRIIREGNSIAILSLGSCLATCLEVINHFKSLDISISLADARFAKPIDDNLVKNLATNHQYLISIETGAIGGFSAQVLESLSKQSLLSKVCFRPIYFPDKFIEHNSPDNQYKQTDIDKDNLIKIISDLLKGV